MIHKTHNYLILTLTLLVFFGAHVCNGQSDTTTTKNDPYDLMSKYYQEDFSPFEKKNWYVGFAFSLTDQQLENQVRLIDKVLQGSDLNYNLSFHTGYFLNDYFMVGGKVLYQRDRFTGDVVVQGDTIQRSRVKSIGTVAPSFKSYFPLTKNERLSFFNEIGVGFGGGNTLVRNVRNNDEIEKIYSKDFTFTAGISPGITFFAIENFAFEVQLNNLIGYQYDVSHKTTNEVEEGKVTSHNVNFNINLLSLNLGLAYYFKVK